MSGKYDCNFICACVLGDPSASMLSKEFGNELKLQHCINAFIDNRQDMPEYGQLGCSGFIVLDAQHNVVSKATSAFMQVRSLAFAHVEALLDALVARQTLPAVCPGEFVRVRAKQPGVNGETAVCLRTDGGSLQVQIVSGPNRGKNAMVPPSMVEKITDEDEPSEGEDSMEEDGQNCGCGPNDCAQETCGPGKCEPGAYNDCNTQALEKDYVESKLSLVSVQVPTMDAEHAECAEALRRLTSDFSSGSLQLVFQALKEHFSHEEALFDEHGYGGQQDDRFSAKRTHIEDHRRLLQKITQQLKVSAKQVPQAFVRDLLQDFHEHTSRYDVQYSAFLSAKGAA